MTSSGYGKAAGLLIINFSRIQTKFNDLVAKFEGAKKGAKVDKNVTTLVSEEWLYKIYNICKCEISEKPKVFNDKISCCCPRENRIPKQELTFLSDQKACPTISLNWSRSTLINFCPFLCSFKLCHHIIKFCLDLTEADDWYPCSLPYPNDVIHYRISEVIKKNRLFFKTSGFDSRYNSGKE